MPIAYTPIGVIRSEHTQATMTPIQPVFAKGCRGKAELLPMFAEGLRDLEGFSHIYLIYALDRAESARLSVRPFLDDEARGVFATRAPTRPNPIGLSIVELLGIEGNTLLLDGLDILDGTPLLDIKPYSARFDRIEDTRNGWQDGVDDETAARRGRRGYQPASAAPKEPPETSTHPDPACAACDDKVCEKGADCYDVADHFATIYGHLDPPDSTLMRIAAEVEATGYMQWPRAQEIVEFCRRAEYRRVGIAFCAGLAEEAATYANMLSREFDVSSVCCKVCGLPKTDFGLPRLREEDPDEVMCSPLAQAEFLNRAGSQLNVVIGLCVGHDALFSRHSHAPVTTLVAKDRVLGHNPVAALYSGYWRRRLGDG
ncbi:MAG: tRNA (N6-threonylcarbamoyladenosine(37)-N6)-methyltransferase TrmO [bacterium]